MSPRLLYLLTIGRARRDQEILRAHREGMFGHDPLSWGDGDDLDAAEWRGYGQASVGESMVRRGR